MKKPSYIILLIQAIVLFFLSCKKENDSAASVFYGKWKTSYGDTITFYRTNDKNIIAYDASMNPTMPVTSNYEFIYKNTNLGIKDGLSGTGDFRFLRTFRWIQQDQTFEVQGIEWFSFISSTMTYFTFTKIS